LLEAGPIGHAIRTDVTSIEPSTPDAELVRHVFEEPPRLDQTLAALPLDERYLPPADSPLAAARPVFQGFHPWNVKKTYQELSRE